MVTEQAPPYRRETQSDAERVDRYFEQLLGDERLGYNSYYFYGVHRSAWVQWHRLRRGWFEHTSNLEDSTGKRTNHQIRLTDELFETFYDYKRRFTRLFLLDTEEDIARLKDKSPRALIKLARKDPPEVLAERLIKGQSS